MPSYEYNIYLSDIRNEGIMTSEEIKMAREKKRQDDLQFVADSVNSGLSITEIRELKPEFSYNEVTPMIKELIQKGAISQEQVDENKKNALKKTMNKDTELSPDEQVQFILDKIRKGYTPLEIVKSDKTKSLSMHKVLYQKRQLIANGAISEKEANTAMQKRQEKALIRKHKRLIDKIKKYTELGYTLAEISKKFIKEYSYQYIIKVRKEYIKNNGWYTDEELQEFVAQRKIREAEEAQRAFESLPPEERERIEAEKREEAERIEEEKRKRKEEVLAKRQKGKEETIIRHQEIAQKLKEYIKSGKSYKQAAEAMGLSVSYISKIKKESIQNNTWLTEDELKAIEKRKKQRQKRKMQRKAKQKKEEQNRKEEENQQRIRDEMLTFREYIEKGYTYNEIVPKMGYSLSYLQFLRKIAIDNNMWFTNEEIKEFRRSREKKKLFEKQEAQKKEEQRKAREQREKERLDRKEEEQRKALNKERKRRRKYYEENYKTYRKLAKKEDRLELNGEENVPTEGRRKFIEILNKLHNLEVDIPDKDVEIVLYLYPQFASKDTLKFLISDANKKRGIKFAERRIVELTNTLKDTKFYEPLIEYRRWIRKQALLPEIKAMKEKGLSNTDIGEKLDITSAEVSAIFYGDRRQDFLSEEIR